MRRAMLAALSVTALALASPGAALAHHGHRGHHKSHSKAHHARVHFEHFGAPAPGSPSGSDTAGPGSPTPTVSTTEDVGKVTSFENEVLTITLNDGTVVKGKVTSSTEIECMSATPTASSSDVSSGEDKGSGDDESGEGDHESSDTEGDSKDSGDDGTVAPSSSEPPCDSSALTPGTGVREAELRIGPSGTEFESIELVR